jgi:hypothetical protein
MTPAMLQEVEGAVAAGLSENEGHYGAVMHFNVPQYIYKTLWENQ